MFRKIIPYTLLLIFIIQIVTAQAVSSQAVPSQTVPSQDPPQNGHPPGRKHPNDTPFYDMEKKGKKPKDVNFKFENENVPDITVDVVEVNNYDEEEEVITNRSKLKIKWSISNENNNSNNKNNTNNGNAPITDNNKIKKFTLKLLGNVTQDCETKLFYSFNERAIKTDLIEYEYEYKIPKLEEGYVYNVAVIAEPDGVSKNNSIGLSRTFSYKYMEKQKSIENNDNEKDTKKKGGKNMLIYLIIGAGCVVVLSLALLISKKISKNDHRESEDELNLPVQSPRSSAEFKGRDINDKNLDRISVVTDDTGEVSWTNLEVAQTSNQTKNEVNDHFIRTLDKTYKTIERNKHDSMKSLEEKQSYKVVRMFIPSEEDEIKLNIGDDVEITDIFEDGWCEGKNISTGEGGVFPRTCVVEADQYATMIEKSKTSTLPSRRRSRRNSYANNNNYYNSNRYLKNNFTIN
jgi:hypothetical protein